MENGFDWEQSLENAIENVIEYLPLLFGALVLLLIGYIISKVAGILVHRGLRKLRFDRAMHSSAVGDYISRIVDSPSRFASRVTFWLLFLLFVSMAASALQLPLLDQIVDGIYAYIPNVIAAIIIFLVASAISAGSAKFIQSVMGRTPTAKMLITAVPLIVMSIAGFMILNQLRIAPEIVNILFTAIVFSIALGLALAFGLGGRDVAREMLEKTYENARQNKGQIKEDLSRAKVNTKERAQRAK